MDQSLAAVAQELTGRKHALIMAITNGDTEKVANLLDTGIPIDTQDDEGKSLLHWAAESGHVATNTVRLLIRRGCEVNSVDVRGLSPLHWAAAMGDKDAVQELIRNGASKSMVVGTFGTPIHQAAIRGHVETVVAMLEESCPLDAVNSVGSTALHWAAGSGHVEVVRKLVEQGCDMNAIKENGSTSLHDASQNGHVGVVRELVNLGCDVNAVDAQNGTPLNRAAAHGKTAAVHELIKLGAKKCVVAGMYGTPLHQAILSGNLMTVEALLEDEVFERNLTKHDAVPANAKITECGIINTCNSYGQTPVMWAIRFGRVEVIKLLTSKGGAISNRDAHALSTLEHCFVGGHASKLSQFCEACGIRSSGEGLRGALATLITRGLIDAPKALCLCAFTGDSALLEDQFTELVASDAYSMPVAMKCTKYYFYKGSVPFLSLLSIPDESALNALHISLLSLKCYRMGFAGVSVRFGTKDHTSFITKLLSHSLLRETAFVNFPNGLSPLDLARQFELHSIARLIEGAGGGPGVWACIPKQIEVNQHQALLHLKEAYIHIKSIAEDGGLGRQFIKHVFSSILNLDGQTVSNVVHAANDSLLEKDRVLCQRPDLGDVVTLVLPHIQVRHWKRVGLALGIKKSILDDLGHQLSGDDDRYLETLSYWLEYGSNMTWKTLLGVLGHFDTKCTVDELADKIVSKLVGGAHQVSMHNYVVCYVMMPMCCGVLSGK